MKRRIWLIAVLAILIVCATTVILLMQCCRNEHTNRCEHTFADKWSYDETYHYKKCLDCGEKLEEGYHNFASQTVKAASCTEMGLVDYICIDCGYNKSESTPMLRHSEGEWQTEREATCTEKGLRYKSCAVCGSRLREEEIPTIEHDFSDVWDYDENAHFHSCSVCGERQSGSETEHDIFKEVDHPTCKREGKIEYSCKVCDYSSIEILPKSDHLYDEWEFDEVKHFRSCLVCGDSGGGEHSFDTGVTVPPDCTQAGSIKYTCTICGYERTESIAASGHKDGEWIFDAQPSCASEGSKHLICAVCGKTIRSESVPKLEHSFGSSWEHDEKEHYHVCAVCGERQLTSIMPHEFVAIDENPPTCTQNGSRRSICNECGYEKDEVIASDGHLWGAWKYNDDATCFVDGTETRFCEVCSRSESRTKSGTKGHIYNKFGVCERCGDKNGPKEPNDGYIWSEDKNYIYMGAYPQSEVKNDGIELNLNMKADDLKNWNDYGYYLIESEEPFMWYIDVEHDGKKYRGVYFTKYRPYYANSAATEENSHQPTNGYKINTVYWFEFMPIKWRVLETDGETAFLVSDVIIDSQAYYRELTERYIGGKRVHSNNYKESDIRAWLNGAFSDTAFDSTARNAIVAAKVDNSAKSTGVLLNSYACEDTFDKVFLLSRAEVDTYLEKGVELLVTDYAKCQGGYHVDGYGSWWLRSPYNMTSNGAFAIRRAAAEKYLPVFDNGAGVAPAIRYVL